MCDVKGETRMVPDFQMWPAGVKPHHPNDRKNSRTEDRILVSCFLPVTLPHTSIVGTTIVNDILLLALLPQSLSKFDSKICHRSVTSRLKSFPDQAQDYSQQLSSTSSCVGGVRRSNLSKRLLNGTNEIISKDAQGCIIWIFLFNHEPGLQWYSVAVQGRRRNGRRQSPESFVFHHDVRTRKMFSIAHHSRRKEETQRKTGRSFCLPFDYV